VIYLIHFDTPIGNLTNPRGQAQHYLGYAFSVEDRVERHSQGRGSFLMKAVVEKQIGYHVVRTWYGNRKTEKILKRTKNSRRLCPVCQSRNIEVDEQ
jgi:hypothetical protein